MKVYQICAPEKLVARSEDKPLLEDANFSGRPFPHDWRSVELLYENGKEPKAEFFGLGSKAIVCSERVRLCCAALEDEGEFLPVKVRGLRGKYYIYNVTHCCSHLNPKKTVWERDAKTGVRSIKSPVFDADRLGEDCIFKIPEDSATAIFCLERDDVPGFESLRTLVKRHGLTGLRFKLVWSDKPGRSKRRR